jgi:hypothetical protein
MKKGVSVDAEKKSNMKKMTNKFLNKHKLVHILYRKIFSKYHQVIFCEKKNALLI